MPDRPATTEIPLERVRPNRHQPRTAFDPEGLAELAASISRHGVLQPIVVSVDRDGYELVAGHRRVLAARLAGRTTIPAVIRDEVGDRLELALTENLQRADLNAIETARAYKLLMETYDLTQEQLAERLGKSRSSVANMLRTLTAPQALQDAVIEGKIAEGHLRALLPLPLSDALQALATVIAKSLSVREAEALARKMVHPTRRGRARPRFRGGDPDLAQVTTELRAALGTKVEILRARRGGRIAIQFYSDEDFERLYEILIRSGKA
jgi:ParB family chromosome partitioning protein